MAFMTVKLQPGVHAEQTPLLLTAGIVQSNLIRWRDGLPEKFGGWRKFYFTTAGGVVTPPPQSGPLREMWAWADFNSIDRLAVGGDAGLDIVTSGEDITPVFNLANVTPTFTTAIGSPLVHVLGVDTNVTSNLYAAVVINNYVAVGGLILFGAYSVVQVISSTEVVINARVNATATVTSGGAVSSFVTTIGSNIVTVTLPNHGFNVGQAVFFLPTTLTGSSPPSDLVVSGTYTVLSVPTANTITIALLNASVNAVGTSPVIYENGGRAQIVTWPVATPSAPGGGWGEGAWGEGGWGGAGIVHTPVSGTHLSDVAPGPGLASRPSLDWCMTNFGEELIAQPDGGGFFRWSGNSGQTTARLIPQAPLAATGFFLAMPQQQLVAYGASTGASDTQDPMLVRWCDNADYTDWTAAVSNQAGSFRLSRGSRIVGGLQAPMQAMLWTDIGFWLMTYIGYPDVWGFNEVAQECGLISKKAAGVCGGQTFWMSRDKFWTFMGGQVQPLPCEVWDAVFQNLNLNLLDHVRCGTNSGFDEVTWYYPSLATDLNRFPGALQENDSYVKFNRVTGEWDYGTPIDVFGGTPPASGGLMVSDFIDNNLFGHPISAMTLSDGTSSQLMWHEMGRDADTNAIDWWFRTGLFLLSEGEDFIFTDRCRADFRWRKFADPQATTSAQVQITLYTQDDSDNPLKPPTAYGPFVVTSSNPVFDPRARGRYFSLKVEGNDIGSFARLGGIKFRFSADGRAG